MNVLQKLTRRLLFALLLAAAALGGCAGSLPDDGPEPVISEAACRAIVERVAAAIQTTPAGGSFSVQATQDELSSFLAIGADVLEHYRQARDAGTVPEPRQIPGFEVFLTDAQWQTAMDDLYATTSGPGALLVRLQGSIRQPRAYLKPDGVLVLRGQASAAGLAVPLRVVLAPESGAQGYTLRFAGGQLGSVGAPSWVSSLFEDALKQGMESAIKYVTIDSIEIVRGEMTVGGSVVQR